MATVVLCVSAGCAALPVDTATATWQIVPEATVTSSTTSIDVLVTRLGCNDGVTGEVNAPATVLCESAVRAMP